MINLLSDNTKKQIRAARTNAVLIRYVLFLFFAVVFLALLCSATYIFLISSKSSAEEYAEVTQSQTNSTSPVMVQANSMRTTLETAKNILGQQISYSNIITEIGAILPSGAILKTLNLSNGTLGSPTIVTVYTSSADDVTKLKDNIKKSLILSSSTVQEATTGQDNPSGHPISINVNLIINKGASK